MFSFPVPDHRTQNHDLRTGRQAGNLRGYLAWTLALYHPLALRTMRNSYAGKQQTEIIIYLRNGPHRGPGIMRALSLVNGNGRTDALNAVHVRLIHNTQELACVCRQAFHVPSLSFRIQGIKRERAFPGTRKPGDHHELPLRNINVDILEVVNSSSANLYVIPGAIFYGFRGLTPKSPARAK